MSGSVRDDVHTRPPRRIPSDHARHDRLLVARLAADDAYPSEITDALALVEGCSQCADLAADIRLLRAAATDLPTPRRPRDFRLTPEQAEALRGSAFERLLRRMAGPGLGALRPVAGVALSLGLALAVVGTSLPAPLATDATDENSVMSLDAGAREPEPASGEDPPPFEAAPGAEAPGAEAPGEAEAEPRVTAEDDALLDREPANDGFARELLIYAGLVLALLSFMVLAIAQFARRRWADPLLR